MSCLIKTKKGFPTHMLQQILHFSLHPILTVKVSGIPTDKDIIRLIKIW